MVLQHVFKRIATISLHWTPGIGNLSITFYCCNCTCREKTYNYEKSWLQILYITVNETDPPPSDSCLKIPNIVVAEDTVDSWGCCRVSLKLQDKMTTTVCCLVYRIAKKSYGDTPYAYGSCPYGDLLNLFINPHGGQYFIHHLRVIWYRSFSCAVSHRTKSAAMQVCGQYQNHVHLLKRWESLKTGQP